MASRQKVALAFAILSAIPGLFYLLAWGMGSVAGFLTALPLAGLMPAGFWLGRRIAKTPRAATIAAAFVIGLSTLGLGLHIAVALSNEPLGALALIVYLLPVQLAGLGLMVLLIAISNRRAGKSG